MVYDSVTVERDAVARLFKCVGVPKAACHIWWAGDQAFVIDPSLDTEVYRRLADEHGWRIVRVFDTHLHAIT